MTSSIPMFSGNPILNTGAYFWNCITDADGLIDKINLLNSYPWKNVNENSNDCFDVKLNHARNNLYIKEINLLDKNKFSDIKSLYVVNSLKMAAEYCAKQYGVVFNRNIKYGNNINIYKQEKSTMFDNINVSENKHKIIIFLNESINSTDIKINEHSQSISFKPSKSSLIMLSPEMSYEMNYLLDKDHYYATYYFEAE